MGGFGNFIKIAGAIISVAKVVGDILDDGKRNGSNQKKN